MKPTVLIIALALIIPAGFASAQTWTERQQIYQEKANLETELFQQHEDMERLQQENESALEEQRREAESQRFEDENAKRQQELEDWAKQRN